ncbi:dipeptide/oligopeptide/nickel ABC transporter permease/ATP-binding protein [Propioniciclava sp. MC1595]|uniref:dipeptide/oligopeptide/nickel ABC transporter permease/ATP-binding protein n=1 Tax=Propioniciclava sp. MC1595 TaxID=2760308 RepID=UPI001662367E|nr:dipeptide/oligopeptide/nickel ABC transporter permease/ATP-binding protein [Propioniciclava sp. MC1595]MBB1495037.1 dipeptide/oligopeptide/nickel ABC transporter permease/ATP-binding protein [Propioniciclava sp. MC1595]QTE26262.1 dipeptide/oligopeptide/nickel ABC transporter permease/ATP-binding protein [Propioniciclava sp. MC1595]
MLSADSRTKLQQPGLRFQGFKTLPIGSKIAVVVLSLMALVAIFAPVVAPYSPDATSLVPADMVVMQEVEIAGVGKTVIPDNSVPPNSMFWFGTDDGGRDIFSRAVHGTRISLVVGLAATGLALVVAAVLGSIAATSRKWVSEVLMRVLDIIMSFPGIALAAVLVLALSSRLPILPVVIIAIALLYVPQLTRVVRANVLAQFGEDYVAASQVMGARTWWILAKHVARNCIAPILVFATVLVADAIVFEASLSFIGAGITSVNTPTWGNMLSEGKILLLSGHWWTTFFPGLLILITTLSLNVLSEGLTDSLASPKIKKRVNVQADEESMSGAGTAAGIAAAHVAQADTLQQRLGSLRAAELARNDRLVLSDADAAAAPLLEVRNLSISFPNAHGDVEIVDNVSFEVRPGETMGLVGESGCGKSITSMAIMGLLPPTAKLTGEILFNGVDLLELSPKEHNALRGHEIAMIYQDALSSLNPSMLISAQFKQLTSRGGQRTAQELLELVGLDPDRTLKSYPHELSGGQRQRVLIAMALTRNPKLVIADEPTTALDVTVQKQVVDLLNELRTKLGFAMVFVSHDLALVASVAHRITVMYAGQVVETGPTLELLTDPRHEYTRGLLGAVLSIESGSGRLHQVPGVVPSPREFVQGDRFAPRSSHPTVGLDVRPEMVAVSETGHRYAAHPDSAYTEEPQR